MSESPRRVRMRPVTAFRIRSTAAFSLVEMLVVAGIIGLLVTAIGMALRDTGGNALATAQTTLASMLNTARAQAAVHQTNTLVAIYATRPAPGDAVGGERYLRLVQVFRDETPEGGSRTWVPVGTGAYLPRGVFVVPPTTTGLLAPGVTWPSNPPLLTTARGPINLGQPTGTPFGTPATALVIEFTPEGTIEQVGNQAYSRVVLTTGGMANNLPQFTSNQSVRGLLLRPTGGITFVNRATAF